MAVVFLLGPGMWDPAKRTASDPAPLQVRREMVKVFRAHDHRVILMEDDPEREGEDLIEKFDRLFRHKVSDVVLYWPPAAKMQTTYDELILLCERRQFLKRKKIRLWALPHSSVAMINRDEFTVLEIGNRGRYLTAVARLGLRPLEWATEEDLKEQARLLASEL